ncbi:MAG: DUF3307 domain-containing protein [Bacteroidetes bacterium]|nr:DUF3307 domain-containing protein [Bacteroidota bacterium]
MIPGSVWLTKLVLAHLTSDFLLQSKSWVDDRNARHFVSPKLYFHGLVTGLLAFLAMGFQHWQLAAFILVTHTLIDGLKSYLPPKTAYFLLDQGLHLLVIAGCWYWLYGDLQMIATLRDYLAQTPAFWKTLTAFVFLTSPTGILIGQLTRQWRDKINSSASETESLANAGKWIGFAERSIILVFVLHSQFSAIGLLVAAKGIIRFNEKDRQEIKTEYLVVGTLLSISMAVATGLLVNL